MPIENNGPSHTRKPTSLINKVNSTNSFESQLRSLNKPVQKVSKPSLVEEPDTAETTLKGQIQSSTQPQKKEKESETQEKTVIETKPEQEKPEKVSEPIVEKTESELKTEPEIQVEESEKAMVNELEALRQAKVSSLQEIEDNNNQIRENDKLWVPVHYLPTQKTNLFDSKGTVFYQCYTYGDYEDINNGNLELQDRYTIMLQGIKCTSLESNLLLPACDFGYISVLRRLEANGTRKFSVPYKCRTCGQLGVYNFTLDDIRYKDIDVKFPMKVRLYSYPEEIFEFTLPTIGDIIFLLKQDIYYKRNPEDEGEYLFNEYDERVPDKLAQLASSCVSHSYEDAYDKFFYMKDGRDFDILNTVYSKLNPGLEMFKFKCDLHLPLTEDEKKIQEENNKKYEMLRSKHGTLPSFMEYLNKMGSEKVCGAENYVTIEGGDTIILPFREYEDNNEYGILSI